MITSFFLVALLLTAVQGAPQQSPGAHTPKIINGTDAEPGKLPYHVSIQLHEEHKCGGSIITGEWILTAAHCTAFQVPESLTVLAGTVLLSEGGERKQVVQIIAHEKFDFYNSTEYDVGLVKVDSSFQFTDNIQPLRLPSQLEEVPVGSPVSIAGWGILGTIDPPPDHLKVADIQVFSDGDCHKILNVTIHPGEICAGIPEGNKGGCIGDSGGALVNNNTAVGIMSWSVMPCVKPPYTLGGYTQVSYYIDWIQEHMK